ncbi:class I SAM-dependent methyltransferase [Conexibacter woesei]|uniref:Methyltransferase type 11 n=1 Tax=Conexibacter woesei (strain DSM 14684 / CCUG 47730 / CIP 108061 / JCM 11494 / NBRC 100937 / ID131577) TaxID=469383 RepID=D3F0C3_CONWI|nr:methyltransferase domain-containing protein [Conexibacter woesei]ADB51983.1 Methyltransferase type 11 [Conexibacter woesei DSM 14684]
MTGPEADEPDPEQLRADMRDRWERSADGWRESSARFTAVAMDVSRWLVDAIEPQPGQRVLELAAGIGETGFLAAELIEPGGTLISSDGAEAMLRHARERAAELGLRNVEFKPIDLEWIDMRTAEVDAVICRWGLMFALDRDASLREMRRVLRPGGRVALATWTAAERNPWSRLTREAIYDAGLIDSLTMTPDPFGISTPEIVTGLLQEAGFTDIEVEELTIACPYAGVADLFAETKSLSRPFADLVAPLDARQIDDLRARLTEKTAPYAESDGSFSLPGVALVAAAAA